MDQLTQTLKDGTMKILQVPFPALNEHNILVRNHFSLISAGTEGKTVKDARLGYLGKAKARKKEVKMVLDSVKTVGFTKTYQMVMNKLDAPSALGYSCAGEVIDIGSSTSDFKIGDRVACGGSGAVHAEIVSVPSNLCVKLDKNIDLKYAAFTTVGSIALQGIRQADLKLGENCVVIGLGLVGQLTTQLLNAGGIKSIGIDIDQNQVEMAKELGSNLALNRNTEGIEQIIKNYTDGFGADAVIITAGTSSSDPIELSGRLCRQKGKVIIVGAVPTGFSREHYYMKELELKMSCSYGPGRYDSEYEEKGIDYPIGYVRWTENRNMKAFADLISRKKVNIEKLVTHIFNLSNASDAYEMILKKSEAYAGILLKYDVKKVIKNSILIEEKDKNLIDKVNIGFIGAGAFAQNMLLPSISKNYNLVGVATSRGNTSKNISQKYKFSYATTASNDVINDDKINTVFITTRHNLHAENVIKSIKADKNVFVEKPLCMNEIELNDIVDAYTGKNILMVGYNRRFSPSIQEIKKRTLDTIPKAINYRINAGYIPKNHWIQDKEVGGGRIIGEVCHFIDLAMYISGSKIMSVNATGLENNENLDDTLIVNLGFENGSIANISYFSNGSNRLSKESIEVFCAGVVYVIDDFKDMMIYSSKKERITLKTQNKGHKKGVELFLEAVKDNRPSPISFEDIYSTTLATLKVIESIKTGATIKLA